MQTYSELTSSLGCSDCKTKFNSASSLLQHFAQHVSRETFKYGSSHSRNDMAMHYLQKKKKKANTILEQVLKRNSTLHHVAFSSQCDPGPSSRNLENGTVPAKVSLSSSSSDLQISNLEYSQSEICDEASETSNLETTENNNKSHAFDIRQNNIGYIYPVVPSTSIDVPLLKCDFQKRLENCITKLVSKKESGPKFARSREVNGDVHKINTLQDDEILEKMDSLSDDAENDFNSMEFCLVSLEDEDNNNDLISNSRLRKETHMKDSNMKTPRNASSRKQKTPKKVQYIPNGELKNSAMEESKASTDTAVSSPMLKRKYPCHLCSKVFGWSTDLKRHILTHTGERPFKCKLCKATFTRNFLLQKHQIKIHKSHFLMSKDKSSMEESSSATVGNMEQECMGRPSDMEVAECSDNASEEKCNQRKGNSPVQVQFVCSKESKLVQNNCNKINSVKKGNKDLRYDRISYDIISQEALNIL